MQSDIVSKKILTDSPLGPASIVVSSDFMRILWVSRYEKKYLRNLSVSAFLVRTSHKGFQVGGFWHGSAVSLETIFLLSLIIYSILQN